MSEDREKELFRAGYTAGVLYGVNRCKALAEQPRVDAATDVKELWELLTTNSVALILLVYGTYLDMYDEYLTQKEKYVGPTEEDEVH